MSVSAKDITGIVLPSSFIGKYVRLKFAGRGTFIGLCPFHNEKTPSFRVNDEKKFFYCFGCGKGGDIFNFLQDYKGISFMEALREIAQENGLSITQFNYKEAEAVREEKSVLCKVKEIFAKQLFSHAGISALKYLKEKRKFTEETIKNFEIGFCPKEQDFLLSYIPQDVLKLVKLGVIGKKESGDFYNPFAGRIIFPIHNLKGETVGFGSRIYTKEQEDFKLAKYVNSKESDVFKKNQIIYGLERFKKDGLPPILVEGYVDVITMHQFGFKSAVAQMGTALSDLQIKSLFSKANEIILCYDKDEAGKKAEAKSIEIALSIITPEKILSFIDFKDAKDTDELLNKFGVEAMQNAINNRLLLHEKIFKDYAQNVDFTNPNQTSVLEQSLKDFCSRIQNEVIRKNYFSYFKNKIYKSKFENKKSISQLPLFEQATFKARDIMLFQLLQAHPFLQESDLYNEYYIPFSQEDTFEKINSNGKKQMLFANFPIPVLNAKEEIEAFYFKMYRQYLIEKLKHEITDAVKDKNFAQAKILKAELVKLENT